MRPAHVKATATRKATYITYEQVENCMKYYQKCNRQDWTQ